MLCNTGIPIALPCAEFGEFITDSVIRNCCRAANLEIYLVMQNLIMECDFFGKKEGNGSKDSLEFH